MAGDWMSRRGILELCGIAIIAASVLATYLIYAARKKGKPEVAWLMTFASLGMLLLGIIVLMLAMVRG